MTVSPFTDCRYSSFISFATEDDRSWNHWISCFKDELVLALPGRLRGIKVGDPHFSGDNALVAGQLSVQLRDNVASSFALFLFVHDNYNASDWCLKELAYFKSLFGDDGFRERLYVIAMSKPAIQELTEGAAWQQLCPFKDQLWLPFFRDDGERDQPIKIYASQITNRAVIATEFWDLFAKVRDDLAKKIKASVASEPRKPNFPSVPGAPLARAPQDQDKVNVYIESSREQQPFFEAISGQVVAGWNQVAAALKIEPMLYLRPTGMAMTDIDERPVLDDADGVVLLWNKKTPDAVAAQIKKVEPKLAGPKPAPGLIAYVMENLQDQPAGRALGNWLVLRFAPSANGGLQLLDEDRPLLEAFLRDVLTRRRG